MRMLIRMVTASTSACGQSVKKLWEHGDYVQWEVKLCLTKINPVCSVLL